MVDTEVLVLASVEDKVVVGSVTDDDELVVDEDGERVDRLVDVDV